MDNELIDLMRTVAASFQSGMQKQVATHAVGLTPFQARVVNLIGRSEGVSQLTLACWTDRDKAQIARAIKELETRGLVTRSAHASDWRAKCLALTAEGKRIHSDLNDLRANLAAHVLNNLTPEETESVRIGLHKMKAALDISEGLRCLPG